VTETLLLQQLESPYGTGRDAPDVRSACQHAPTTNADANQHSHSH